MGKKARRTCRDKTRVGNSYANEDEARVACARLNGKRAALAVERKPIRPFLCLECGRWHIGKAGIGGDYRRGRN